MVFLVEEEAREEFERQQERQEIFEESWRTQMSKKWKRFEESDKDQRRDILPIPKGGTVWAVIWDVDPRIFFVSYPGNWGGSGWYANPEDVILKPTGEF